MNSILHFDVSLGRTGFAHNELSLFHLAQIGSTKGTFSDCQPPCLSPIACAPPVQTACQKLHARKTRIAPCQVVLALGVCGTSGRWPQSPALQLYAKLQNVAVVRFSLRNSIQQGLWTCQNFDLWMQELTTRLGVSGILCAASRRRRVSSRTSSVVPKCGLTQSPVAKSQ